MSLPSWSFKMSLTLLVIAVFLVIPVYLPNYGVTLLISVFLYTTLTLNWGMFSGPSGYMSLASAAFFGVGIYTNAMFGNHLPIPVVVLLGGILSALLALFIGITCLRLKGIYFAIFTFGITELILHSLMFYELEISGQVGRLVVEMAEKVVYYSMFGLSCLSLGTSILIKRSKFGLALNSIGQDEQVTACMGINVKKIKILLFAVTAGLMGMAGTIIVTQWTYVDPKSAFNIFYSFLPALMALFGGVSSIVGQILGAVFLTLLTEMLLTQFPYIYMLIFGLLILAIIIFSPSGIMGMVDTIKNISNQNGKRP